MPICEDMWLEPVCAHLAELGAEMFLVPHGSPYELDKIDTRERLARARTTSTGLPLVFLNRVGGQDELAFDGSSFIMHPDGETRGPDGGLGRGVARSPNGGAVQTAGAAKRVCATSSISFPPTSTGQ